MSRIGKLAIEIPASVKVTLEGAKVNVEGPKGKLEQTFDDVVTIVQKDAQIYVQPKGNSRYARAMHGTVASIIRSMVMGVQKLFFKELEITGVGFKASVADHVLDLSLGYSHPIRYNIPANVTVTTPEATKIRVESPSKFLAGQVAADIKHYYPAEPYKGKGVRIVGEFVRRKEGKKTA
ncbi:MAG: 50S ribosomal protein L6 [Puniceicoccales bacterium]|jgi:large subunit ribosomal protein L6|nr:50S ribosomal protein L6 [Puniceicoccales bacterium]